MQLQSFIEQNNILSPSQFSFRKHSSTENALVAMTEFIYSKLNLKHVVVIVQLDLSKAFDKVDHRLLLQKLKWYGIDSTWFASYLINRSHITTCNGQKSKSAFTKSGVPQGSVLGPILFTLFINDLPLILKLCLLIMFADDSNLCFSSPIDDVTRMWTNINTELENVTAWMDRNGMQLNVKKTKLLVLRPNTKQKIEIVPNVFMSGVKIEESSSVKFLGLTVDNQMNWNGHTRDMCKKVYAKANVLKQMTKYCTIDTRKTLITATCLPIMRYCCTIWGSANQYELKAVDRAIKYCARIVLKKKFSENVAQDLPSLG